MISLKKVKHKLKSMLSVIKMKQHKMFLNYTPLKIKSIYLNIFKTVPAGNRKKIHLYLFKSICFGLFDLVSISMLIPVVILLLTPDKLNQVLIEHNLIDTSFSTFHIQLFLSILIALYAVKIIFQMRFNTALYHFFYNLSTKITIRNTNEFILKSYINHLNLNSGKVIQQINNAPEDFSCKVLLAFVSLISEIIVLCIILLCLLFLYFKITVIAIVLLTAVASFLYFNKQNQLKLFNSIYRKAQIHSNLELLNIISGYLEIKNSGNYKTFLKKFKKEKKLLNQTTGKLISLNMNYSRILELALIGAIITFTAVSYDNSNILIQLAIFGTASLRLIPSISRILNAITSIKAHWYSIDVLNQNTLDATSQNKIVPAVFEHELKLEKIEFGYGEETLFNKIDLCVKKGEFVGIKGASGIGKTTLLYILLGMIKITKGTYYVDSVKIENCCILSFANYVPQQPFIFNGSIIDNIVMGQKKKAIDYNLIYNLCRQLQLDTIFKSMRNGYDTVLSQDGNRLSGGQKQRLALVRALYTKPTLLILDEATNQQDKALEWEIFKFLNFFSKTEKVTVVSVFHSTECEPFLDTVYSIKNKSITKV